MHGVSFGREAGGDGKFWVKQSLESGNHSQETILKR